MDDTNGVVSSIGAGHIIVIGAGRIGYRIITGLLAMNEQVVAVDRRDDNPLVAEVRELGVTVICGEARLRGTLERAGVANAQAVILAADAPSEAGRGPLEAGETVLLIGPLERIAVLERANRAQGT